MTPESAMNARSSAKYETLRRTDPVLAGLLDQEDFMRSAFHPVPQNAVYFL